MFNAPVLSINPLFDTHLETMSDPIGRGLVTFSVSIHLNPKIVDLTAQPSDKETEQNLSMPSGMYGGWLILLNSRKQVEF